MIRSNETQEIFRVKKQRSQNKQKKFQVPFGWRQEDVMWEENTPNPQKQNKFPLSYLTWK